MNNNLVLFGQSTSVTSLTNTAIAFSEESNQLLSNFNLSSMAIAELIEFAETLLELIDANNDLCNKADNSENTCICECVGQLQSDTEQYNVLLGNTINWLRQKVYNISQQNEQLKYCAFLNNLSHRFLKQAVRQNNRSLPILKRNTLV